MHMLYQNLNLSFLLEDISVHVLTLALERLIPQIPSHSHGPGCYEIHYIISGRGTLLADGCPYEIVPDSIYVTGPSIVHSELSLPEDPMCEYCLYFKINAPVPGRAVLINRFLSQSLWLGKDRQNLLPLLKQISYEMQKQPSGYQEQLSALLKQFFISMVRNYTCSEHTLIPSSVCSLERQKSVIAEDCFLYEYRTLSLKELSLRLGLSPRQTERFLKDCYGKTFLQKRTEARMSAAVLLLTRSDASITSIAEQLGYSSLEHFTSAFHKAFGTSPRCFRRQNRAKGAVL